MTHYYKVLLVDDEAEIREGMAQRIPWETLGFKIIGTAENGLEALDIIEKDYPEIIITDIQMPFMDGLALIERARSLLPLSKFIVFSGCDVFEYAQKAVSLHVAEYLLKPFSAQDLITVLVSLKQKMDQEKQERRDIAKLQRDFEDNLPLLRQSFLLSCLSGLLTPERMDQQRESFSLPIEKLENYFCCESLFGRRKCRTSR
ncbi:MAG: response regulator, partial [Enterococcus aquimarinus]|nr:response regulator [Enterococcus aquimarinus]